MKLNQLFFRRQPAVRPLYAAIVAAARQPRLYGTGGAPDTPEGRLAMINLHLALAFSRLKQERAAQETQALVEALFEDVEGNLRESGVSDVAIPKRMREIEALYVLQMRRFEAALESGPQALQSALSETVPGWQQAEQGASPVAVHIQRVAARLAQQPLADILSGKGWTS